MSPLSRRRWCLPRGSPSDLSVCLAWLCVHPRPPCPLLFQLSVPGMCLLLPHSNFPPKKTPLREEIQPLPKPPRLYLAQEPTPEEMPVRGSRAGLVTLGAAQVGWQGWREGSPALP